MTTPKTKTTEEIIIDEYMYVIKLVKVYNSIKLATDKLECNLESCYQNDPTIHRLQLTHWAKQRESGLIESLTGIHLEEFRNKFLKSELQKSGNFINLSLINLQSNEE